jgi:uncharacterized protein YgfB (UPF0149 family)
MITDCEIKEYASGIALVPQADAVELAARHLAAAAANRQLEQELGEAVAALRALCRATGDESEDEGLAIWLRADEICALHDEETA